MAYIDGALFNSKGRRRGIFISLEDTLRSLEEGEVEEEFEDEEEEGV
jgi:hypothetical protein